MRDSRMQPLVDVADDVRRLHRRAAFPLRAAAVLRDEVVAVLVQDDQRFRRRHPDTARYRKRKYRFHLSVT